MTSNLLVFAYPMIYCSLDFIPTFQDNVIRGLESVKSARAQTAFVPLPDPAFGFLEDLVQ